MSEQDETTEAPETVEAVQAPEPESKIYLGADGGYHDDTEENRERFPAAEDVDAEQVQTAADAVGGDPVPFTEGGEVDGGAIAADTSGSTEPADGGTVTEAGEDAGLAEGAKPQAKTRNK